MKSQRGFTLLEMLAALAVLALCTTVLLGGLGLSAHALQASAEADRLGQAALSVIDSLDNGPLQPGRREGRWDAVAWVCQISPLPSPAGPGQLLRLDLSLNLGSRRLQLSTLRVRSGGVAP